MFGKCRFSPARCRTHTREEEEEEEEEEEGKFIHFSIVYKLRNREPEKRRND